MMPKMLGLFSSVLLIFMAGKLYEETSQTMPMAFQSLQAASDSFAKNVIAFPTKDNLIRTYASTPELQREVVDMALGIRPLIHADLIPLINEFLAYKSSWGSSIEKKLYASMTLEGFIDRLLQKRPLMFMTEQDSYLLRNGLRGYGGFESIGTPEQKPPLELEEYLSYDEMTISAMLDVSVPTYFINAAARNNLGKQAPKGTYQCRGIYVGMVGSRFERPGLMEWAHIMITPQQNTTENGYGSKADYSRPENRLREIWARFYQQGNHERAYFPSYKEAQADTSGRYLAMPDGTYFNTAVYKERMRMSVEPFLVDANARAQKKNTHSYVYAVGAGLGVWVVTPLQRQLLLEVYLDVIDRRNLSHISDLQISWMPPSPTPAPANHSHIALHFSNRNPADLLKGQDHDKLLVASYAWDGNAFPGNEYWEGLLNASGDPAAACCSAIPELQNPYINTHLSSRALFIVADPQ